MVVGQQSVWRVVRVGVDYLVVHSVQVILLCQLQTPHLVVIFKYIIEGGIVANEDVDGFIANELQLLLVLLLHFLPTHSHDITVFLFPRFHPTMKVVTHAHSLHLHIDFA